VSIIARTASRVRYVGANGTGFTAESFDLTGHSRGTVSVDVSNDDRCAFLRKTFGNCLTETGAGAGDHRHFPGKSLHVRPRRKFRLA
jgi:hypothetical protein